MLPCLTRKGDDMTDDTIVGYTFDAENLCPRCMLNAWGNVLDRTAEDMMNREAAAMGINRADESSFDSGTFPKIITPQLAEHDKGWGSDMRCNGVGCGHVIGESECA